MVRYKFRAWDKVRNEFLSGGQILIAIQPGRNPKSNPIYLDVLEGADMYNDRFELMQYAGLQDKNGREIYEGDIVKFNGDIGTVTFECGCFGIGFDEAIDYDAMLEEIHATTRCDNPLDSCQNDNFISLWEIHWNYNEEDCMLYSVEVIGNIYDNPDLLKDGADNA